jgi:RNA polymerase sigma-70 factor (ECF subfamily)
MAEESSFAQLLLQLRGGDQQAAAELLRVYEPYIRRTVRMRLTDSCLRRQFDSIDFCQSVMGDFFVRFALGQFDLQSPGQLISLLAKMARNKVIDHARRQKAARRDVRRLESGGMDESAIAGADPTPSRVASGKELLDLVRARLTERDRYLAGERAAGRSWQELADELGENADALRMRLSRALDRVGAEVGLSIIK